MLMDFSSVGCTSWDVEGWVRKNSTLTGTAFLVALTAASLHSRRRGYAFPSIEHLAACSRVSTKTVQRAIEQMRDSGEWIIVTGRGGTQSNNFATARANRYYPTAKLAGHDSETTDTSDIMSVTEALKNALDSNDAFTTPVKRSIMKISDALPNVYQDDFSMQISEPKNTLKVIKMIDDLNALGSGIDLKALLMDRINASRSAPKVILSWLAVWGLKPIKPGEYMLTDDVDYGQTGGDF